METRIFITRPLPARITELLSAKGYSVDTNPKDILLTQKQLIRFLKKKPYDAVLTLLTDKIDSAVFDATPSVKLYANYSTGYDNIDIVEAKKRGIVVTNAPTEETATAVAEHTIALLLALSTRLVDAHAFVRKGKFKGWNPSSFVGTRIAGKILGLVGCGAIGQKVAALAHALGMEVIYTDVKRNDSIETEYGAKYYESLDALLTVADVVSIHAPLLPSTHHLFDATRLSHMKPTAYIINTSRGPVIDERALEDALYEKQIAGAGLDVFEFEPTIRKRLRRLPTAVLTPHIASATIEARNAMTDIVIQNIVEFFEGRTPPHTVTS
ncbi:MAG: D-glycerate dehydrogenase [Candidatus Pacebacteria bacterium]|nr:D-glycerate dehydrogenase [Candidatus Paceibacterota bacterium]